MTRKLRHLLVGLLLLSVPASAQVGPGGLTGSLIKTTRTKLSQTVPSSYSVAEDSSVSLTGISVSTIAAGSPNTLETVLTVGVGVFSGYSGTNTMTLVGTAAAINAVLANATYMTYTPTELYYGGDTLTVTTHNVSQGDYTISNTSSITVNPTCANSTGGSIAVAGGYRYHIFTGSGTWSTPGGCTVNYLVVGGGGAGGAGGRCGACVTGGGGGGGGGGIASGSVGVGGGGYGITVGSGGQYSYFDSIVGPGPGGAGAAGGSGFGGAGGGSGGSSGAGGVGGSYTGGGGTGGANGGAGFYSTMWAGTGYYYGSGGGGGGSGNQFSNYGGGGGGGGADSGGGSGGPNFVIGSTSGTPGGGGAFYGAGGGGGGGGDTGAAGGGGYQGVVIISYSYP